MQVIFIDGRGTGLRSRSFREHSHKNLGGGAGGDDHIAVIRQMAEQYPCLDLGRVGIYGHSAGGYDSTHAILSHPEFCEWLLPTSLSYVPVVESADCLHDRGREN